MTARKHSIKPSLLDPADDAPELTREWFEAADLMIGDTVIRRGRPKSDLTKVPVSIRLSPDVLAHFKAGGPGWQTRIDAALRQVATKAPPRAARTQAPRRSRQP